MKQIIECEETKQECDTDGDNRDGWPNCSACGETDWMSLFKKNFKVNEVMELITQDEEIMDMLGDIEVKHFRDMTEQSLVQPYKLIHSSIMDSMEIDQELANDNNPFDYYLGDRELLVENLVLNLSKKNKMRLFIHAHDKIFGTTWVDTQRTLWINNIRGGFEL